VLDGKVLGAGVSGTVRRVVHRSTGIQYAVKCLDLTLINTPASLLQLRNEIFIMCQLDHPNVMRIEEVYESNNELYIVQEICVGGDLFDRLDQQPHYHYTEEQCASLVKQVTKSCCSGLNCFVAERKFASKQKLAAN
jgi:calcium-dependent protein kinase